MGRNETDVIIIIPYIYVNTFSVVPCERVDDDGNREKRPNATMH